MSTFTQRTMQVGMRVKFGDDRFWWTVRAVSEHFTALTRPDAFAREKLRYTVIDWDKGIRGPCNLVGQGYDIDTDKDCQKMLSEFENGRPEASEAYAKQFRDQGRLLWPSRPELEISHRNRVPLDIIKIEQGT